MVTNTIKQRKLIPIKQAVYMTLSFGCLLASLMLFFVEPALTQPFFARPLNVYRIVVMAASMIFLLLATSKTWLNSNNTVPPSTNRLLRVIAISVPLLAIIALVVQLLWPEFAVNLVRKEDWPMYRNAIFVKSAFELVGAIVFLAIAGRYAKKHQWLAMITAIIVALIFVVMIGEELSWGQRIIGWATPDDVAAWNEQGETNFHNSNTQLFQNVLYFGCWLLLIAMSFWRSLLTNLLRKIKPLSFLIDWLPPFAFAVIFAVSFGFSDPLRSGQGLAYGSNLFIAIATLIVLVALIIKYAREKQLSAAIYSIVVTAIYTTILLACQFIGSLWDYNTGAVTEYLEVFIIFGLMTWAITVNQKLK